MVIDHGVDVFVADPLGAAGLAFSVCPSSAATDHPRILIRVHQKPTPGRCQPRTSMRHEGLPT